MMNVKLLSIKKSHQLVGALHIFRVDSPYPPLVMNAGKKNTWIDICNRLLGSALQKNEEEKYKKNTKYQAVDYLSGRSKLVPQGPKFLWHSPRTLDLKYEN